MTLTVEFDLILMDCNMPVLDGFEVARSLCLFSLSHFLLYTKQYTTRHTETMHCNTQYKCNTQHNTPHCNAIRDTHAIRNTTHDTAMQNATQTQQWNATQHKRLARHDNAPLVQCTTCGVWQDKTMQRTTLHSTAQHSTVQHTTQHTTIQHTPQHATRQHTTQHATMLYEHANNTTESNHRFEAIYVLERNLCFACPGL